MKKVLTLVGGSFDGMYFLALPNQSFPDCVFVHSPEHGWAQYVANLQDWSERLETPDDWIKDGVKTDFFSIPAYCAKKSAPRNAQVHTLVYRCYLPKEIAEFFKELAKNKGMRLAIK